MSSSLPSDVVRTSDTSLSKSKVFWSLSKAEAEQYRLLNYVENKGQSYVASFMEVELSDFKGYFTPIYSGNTNTIA